MIPRALWPIVGPRYAPATFAPAFVHDALYAAKLVSREYADWVFYEHLRRERFRMARAYWAAVRVVGGVVWRGRDDVEVELARMKCRIERRGHP